MAIRGRRKAIVMDPKSWMVFSETGESIIEDLDKYTIMRRTGLPARDLRVLDPTLFYPSSIMGREKSIVVNLEHIKAIITSNEVLIINSSSPFFILFLQDLQARVPRSNNIHKFTSVDNGMDGECESKKIMEEGSPLLQSRIDSMNIASKESFEDDTLIDVAETSDQKPLPFEFKALETCIESACACLEYENQRLEEEAYPALDELATQISTLNLEHVRHIKNRLVALSGRVQKVANQLENLLDDDNDMAEMYLTKKLDDCLVDQTSLKKGSNSNIAEDIDERFYESKPDVEELEMLLEAYFAQINGISQRMSSLSEYVDDTEDHINIMLDDKRNQLLQVTIIFSTTNVIMAAGIAVVGLFGMNVHIDLFDGQPRQFWATVGGTFSGCILLLIISIWWGKKRYILSESKQITNI
ncbi:magnesium transporter MRS2-F [Lathyrus oleraceus]|uniref:magnesium transporter MRS2-F n=1 Tax=Pisum sativum TaxID=3888 RepID=UPI0021D3E99A|nr:magnesium transporter MRS2-F-like [Pisum sativum]